MTDVYLRRPRWSTTAVVVPAGAVLLTGATAWALHANAPAPVTVGDVAVAAAAPAAEQVAVDPASDPVLVSLRTAVEKSQAEVDALQKKVDALNAKAAKAKGTAATAIKARKNYAKVAVPSAPRTVYVKAPSTHTSTGASGG